MTLVYRNLDQTTLDTAYNTRATVDSMTPYLTDYARLTAEAKAKLQVHGDISYADQDNCTLDIYQAGTENTALQPAILYLQGGDWQHLTKDESAFMAVAGAEMGISTIALNFGACPDRSIMSLVENVRTALAWLYHQGRAYGLDRDRIFLVGQGSGAQLAAMALADHWHEARNVPDDLVRGAILLSGLYDLEPIAASYLNTHLQLDATTMRACSPIHHLPRQGCPLIIATAERDTDEYKRQSRDFAVRWIARGFDCCFYQADDYNHYNLCLDLTRPTSRLMAYMQTMIGPKPNRDLDIEPEPNPETNPEPGRTTQDHEATEKDNPHPC